MNTILKLFAAWATSLVRSEFSRAALRLTASYVLGVAVILGISSLAIYWLVIDSIPPLTGLSAEVPHAELSLYEFREHLVGVMLLVNGFILGISSVIAYWFARRTLRPIEENFIKQQRFVSDVAHELRTPLAVLKAGSQVLRLKERSSKEYNFFAQDLEAEIDRLTRLTNDLLRTLAPKKVDAIKLFETVDLSGLVTNQVTAFAAYATEHAVVLHTKLAPQVLVSGNQDSLIRLLQNLLKNAIDYNQPTGSVTVELKTDDKSVHCIVSDTGIGIPEADQPKIFDRFYKSDTARGAVGGSGLGLAIVKDIVSENQGTISVVSTVGTGTAFYITFPRPS